MLDINTHTDPDYYLVLTGPKANAETSRGKTRPWLIKEVFLFETKWLLEELKKRRLKIGVATSVAQTYWELAKIYPDTANHGLPLAITEEQKSLLSLFG